ncbi:MAG: TRAP transporter small permease [Granulosicoccus sp.]|nr:TRAP transporter small permease [Granulosicoccus sp.]
MFRLLDKTAEALAVLAFAVSSAFIFLNVLNRYIVLGFFRNLAKEHENLRPLYFSIRDVLSNIVVTADEVPGLLLVWVAFLGAYIAMRHEGHIAFTLFLEKLPYKARRIVTGISTSLISAFLVLVFIQSLRMIKVSGRTEIETAEIAQGWFMLILPLASVLLLIAVIQRFRSER